MCNYWPIFLIHAKHNHWDCPFHWTWISLSLTQTQISFHSLCSQWTMALVILWLKGSFEWRGPWTETVTVKADEWKLCQQHCVLRAVLTVNGYLLSPVSIDVLYGCHKVIKCDLMNWHMPWVYILCPWLTSDSLCILLWRKWRAQKKSIPIWGLLMLWHIALGGAA